MDVKVPNIVAAPVGLNKFMTDLFFSHIAKGSGFARSGGPGGSRGGGEIGMTV